MVNMTPINSDTSIALAKKELVLFYSGTSDLGQSMIIWTEL